MRKRIFTFALFFALSAVPVFAAENVSSGVSSLIPQSNSNGDAEEAVATAEALRQLSEVFAAEEIAAGAALAPAVAGEGGEYRDAQGNLIGWVTIGSVTPGTTSIDVFLQDPVCTLGCGPTDRQYSFYQYDFSTRILTTSTKVLADYGSGGTVATANVSYSSADLSARTANNEALAFQWTKGMANMISAVESIRARQNAAQFKETGKFINMLAKVMRQNRALYARVNVPGGFTDVVQIGTRTITKSAVGNKYYEIDISTGNVWLNGPAGTVIQTTKKDNPILWLEVAYATRDAVKEAVNQSTTLRLKKIFGGRLAWHNKVIRTHFKASIVLPSGLVLTTERLYGDLIIRCDCFTLVIALRSGTIAERNEDTGVITVYKPGEPGYAARINSYLKNVTTALSVSRPSDRYEWGTTQNSLRQFKVRYNI